MPAPAIRQQRAARGDCGNCGARKPAEGRKSCERCLAAFSRSDARKVADGRHAAAMRKQFRKPSGWARHKAHNHRKRVRAHNAKHPDRPLLENIIDGPALLAHIVAQGPTCGLCDIHTGFPWEHVGKESGPEVDHILSMWAILNEGRQDWASVSNTRLLCVSCHSTEGIRLKRQDIEFQNHMEHMLGKDTD